MQVTPPPPPGVKVIKDQIQYRSQTLLNLARDYFSLFSKEYSMDNIFKGKLMKLNHAFIVILVSSIFLVIQSHQFSAHSQIRTPLALTVILRYRKSNKSSGRVLK